jgi:hypothetical protein
VRNRVHLVAQGRQRQVHAAPGAALVAERPMLGDRMPRVVREAPGEFDLRL